MFYSFAQLAAIVSLCVYVTHQVEFSNEETNRSESSPERVQKHENYLNTLQNAKKDCAEGVVGSSSTDTMIDYIISMDKNLKGNVNDTPTQNFFGCICKLFNLVSEEGNVRTEALEKFFDAAEEEDGVSEIKTTCGGRYASLNSKHYLVGCLEIFRCLEEFDDDEDN